MKLKLLILVLIFNTILAFSQSEIQNNNSAKRVIIDNPTEHRIHILQNNGIDLRCGAVFEDNSLKLELTSVELENLKKAGISYEIEIDNLTKFYAERAARDLPVAQAQLAAEKAKAKSKQSVLAKTASSISSVGLDNPLQYSGINEVDWAVPSNFVFGSMGSCLTVSETLAQLDLMRTLYPNIISVKTDASPTNQTTWGNTTGTTWAGQTVYYAKISDNPDGIDDATEPDVLYTSMIHSRELSALMGNIYFMWYLLENYATDTGVKSLVDNNELFFVPIVNPDGLRWNEVIAPGGGGLQRKNLRPGTGDTGSTSSLNNVRGVDVNRNFNYLWGSAGDSGGSDNDPFSNLYRGPSAFSEPESEIMRDFILSKDFKTAVWQHSYSNAIPHPYGGIPTKVSDREDEMHKWHEDMTKYNRYISGAQVFPPANGIADDWMLGGTVDGNGSFGSGMNILATTPENGHYNERDSSRGFSGFWPSPTNIVPIAKRMVRINFMNAYYGGKYAKFNDLTQSDITALSSNLTFGIERIGQTASDFTLEVTPISINIQSITSPLPATLAGMTILEQRNVTAALVLDSGITANEKIEFNVKLKNGDGVVFYDINIVKYFTPTVLFADDPDTDILMENWIESINWVNSATSSWSGTNALKAGSAIPYADNINNTLTTTNSYDFSGANEILVQFYSKWDLERNYDFVELLGSPDNGSTWYSLNGKYTKPPSYSDTNDSHYYPSTKSATNYSFQDIQSIGNIYDGDQMDNWVLEEIVIDASNNSALLNAANAQFRFVFKTDSNNRPENYSTTYDGFFIDDFKIIKVTVPCVTSIPTSVNATIITTSSATIGWDLTPSATYDVRYRVVGSPTWIDVLDIGTTSYNITGLTVSANYEVQVRSKCTTATSAYTNSVNFTTLSVSYCASSGTTSFPTGITSVLFNTLSNADINNQDNAYEDYTNLTTDLDKSNTYNLEVKVNTDGNFRVHAFAWIDFNRDGDFNDLGEEFDLGFARDVTNGTTSISPNITIPPGAVLGSTRMRISAKYNADPTSCETGFDGEVEDYSINIIDSTLGIEDEILNEFILYPNPVKDGEIKLNVPREITDFNVAISNVLGQTVYESRISDNYDTAHKVNTSNLKPGIYFVTVSTNLGMATKKMIIQ